MAEKYELAYAVSDAKDLAACGCAIECAMDGIRNPSWERT